MATTESLSRRLASANERLTAARLDGNCADIVTWRNICDHLLDEWPKTPQPKGDQST